MHKSLLLLCLFIFAYSYIHSQETTPWLGKWIWSEQGVKENYFRYTFNIEKNNPPIEGKIAITCDNIFELYLNGKFLGKDDDWATLEVYDIKDKIKAGKNVIAVKCMDPGGDCGALLVEGYIKLKNDDIKIIASDENWKITQKIPTPQMQQWTEVYFDDTSWATAKPYGKPPMLPWGALSYPSFGLGEDIIVDELKILKGAPLPGNKIDLFFKITPKAKGITPTTIGIRLLKENEVIFEKYWIAASQKITEWVVNKTISFTLENVYIPKYCPFGDVAIELVIPGYRVDKTSTIKIGTEKVLHVPRAKIIAKDVTTKGGYLKAKLYVNSETNEPLYVQIYKNKNILVFADSIPFSSTELCIKIDILPKGEYYLKLCQHKSICIDCKLYKFKIYNSNNKNVVIKPLGYGEYRDRFGVPHRWYINHCNTLIRDGKPYIPVGGMYISAFHNNFNVMNIESNEKNWERDMERLSLLISAGVSDLYLNPCVKLGSKPAWVYQRLFDAMEEKGIYYGWQVTTPMSPLKGFSICLDKFSLEIEGPGTYNIDIIPSWIAHVNEHTKVFYSVISNTKGEIISTGRAPSITLIKGGIRATVTVPSLPEKEKATIYCIPEVIYTGDMHDYWTDFNKDYENTIKTVLKKAHLGEKFVCFVDPLDNEQSLRDEHQLIPSCEAFQKMLSDFLKNKYKTISNLVEAWALLDNNKTPTDWAYCGRLIPIGRGKKGTMYEDIGYVLDIMTNIVYKIDLKKSQFWYDILEFRNSSIRNFNNRAADILKSVHNVPVVLKLTGEDSFTNNREVGGFDGVGFEAYGKGNELIRGCGGGVFSRAEQAARTMWCLVTETNMSGPEEEYIGYTDPLRLVEELNTMVAGGAKGVYVFYFNACTDKPPLFYNFDLFHDERQLYWLGAYSQLLKSSHKLPSYKTSVDFLFPAKHWGIDGFRRIQPDFYSLTPETSILGNEGRWATPCSVIPKTDDLHLIVNLIDTPITKRYKAILEEAIKKNIKLTFIGLRRDLGALPFIDKYYTNITKTDIDNKEVQILNPDERCNILAKTNDAEMLPWAIEVDNIRIFAKNDFENIVKTVTRPPEKKINFLKDILDAEMRTYGKAIMSLSFGDTTYLWNTLSQDVYLQITTNNELKYIIGGNSFKWSGKMNVRIPKLLSLPTIIKGLSEKDSIEGIDEINKLYALEEWNKVASKGKQIGLNIPDITGLSCEEILETAKILEKQVKEAENTTYFYKNNVIVDGDLSEWKNIPPIYLRVKVVQDFNFSCEYKDARFYLGYDNENLYIAGEINDEAVINLYRGKMIWNGDAIEIFIDTNPDMETTYDGYTEYCYQFLFSPTNADAKPDMAVAGNPKLDYNYVPHNNKVAAKIHSNGYNIECAINYKELGGWKPKANSKIGFSLALDDADKEDRTVQYLWRGKGDLWKIRTRFGKAYLK